MKELKTIREAIKAILDGKEVEFRSTERGDHSPLKNLFISFACIDDESDYEFRIKPSKPSIDWSQVSDGLKYLAVDKSGQGFLYSNKPTKQKGEYWFAEKSFTTNARGFASYKAGDCEWYESLVERPKN